MVVAGAPAIVGAVLLGPDGGVTGVTGVTGVIGAAGVLPLVSGDAGFCVVAAPPPQPAMATMTITPTTRPGANRKSAADLFFICVRPPDQIDQVASSDVTVRCIAAAPLLVGKTQDRKFLRPCSHEHVLSRPQLTLLAAVLQYVAFHRRETGRGGDIITARTGRYLSNPARGGCCARHAALRAAQIDFSAWFDKCVALLMNEPAVHHRRDPVGQRVTP